MKLSIASRSVAVVALFIVACSCTNGQQPPQADTEAQKSPALDALQPPENMETPGERYKAAMHPLDMVRSSLDNWSEAELGALSVGIRNAREACQAGDRNEYSGDDLYDFARLCALGQDWSAANAAALAYVASKLKKHRAQAYALSVNALVHLDALDLADETTLEMLRVLPYDAEVAYAVQYMKIELDDLSSPKAVELAGQEHPGIVAALAQHAPLRAVQGDAVMGIGQLFDSAMEMAFWQRYAGDASGAAATVADIDHALPSATDISVEDATRVKSVRTRYHLLGESLPAISPIRSLESVAAKPILPIGHGSVTVLVLFPDWCGGCRKMMKPLTDFDRSKKNNHVRAYGLVFEDDSVSAEQTAHEEFLKDLRGTSTLVVPASAAQTLGAENFPLGIVLDERGSVAFIGTLPMDAFKDQGLMEKTIQRIAKTGGQ